MNDEPSSASRGAAVRQASSGAAPQMLTRVIGISLGGARGKTTALARLERRDTGWALVEARSRGEHRGAGSSAEYLGPLRDEALFGYLERWLSAHTVVAIDAPLTLPPCVRCTLECPGAVACTVEEVTWLSTFAERLREVGEVSEAGGRGVSRARGLAPYAMRPADVIADYLRAGAGDSVNVGLDSIGARANYLRRALGSKVSLNDDLIEVDPRLSLQRWFGVGEVEKTRRGETEATWSARLNLLTACTRDIALDGVWPELVVRSPPVFLACIAAVTGLRRHLEGWEGPPQPLEMAGPAPFLDQALRALSPIWRTSGWVWVPPSKGLHS